MSQTPLEATTTRTDAGATIALSGDIDGGAREALDAAYAEVEGGDAVLLDFSRVGLHQLHRHRPDRRACWPGPAPRSGR